MRRVPRWLPAILIAVAAAAAPAPAVASGRANVAWKKVDAPPGDNHDRIVRTLRTILKTATRKANFGKRPVALTARVTEFTSVTRGDVHRVTCTLVGRIVGGPTARSRISFGGHAAERAALEKQVLTMVANGVVTRLAEIAKNRDQEEE
jgi:hypothetical protein